MKSSISFRLANDVGPRVYISVGVGVVVFKDGERVLGVGGGV